MSDPKPLGQLLQALEILLCALRNTSSTSSSESFSRVRSNDLS